MSQRFARHAMLPRLRVGARAGARLGLYFGLLAALVAANPILWRSHRRDAPESPLPIFSAVWIGFFAGGIIVALGRPSVRDKYGAALLGAAATAPLLVALAVTHVGRAVLSARGALGIGSASLLVGGWIGVAQWSPRANANGW